VKLRALEPEGRRLVTQELASGAVTRWPESEWRPLTADCERALDLDAFDAVIDRAIATYEPYDAGHDPWLAPRLHEALPLTRREAAAPGVWRFLAVVHRPDLVRHRWENLSWATTKTRFWSTGTRHTSNAFARLWWIAEITRAGASYALTEKVLVSPRLATQVFVRTWSQHRPAVAGFVEAMEDAAADEIERATREFSRHLAVVPLEGLDADDVAGIVATIRRGRAA
jgi:hypothetical protein